MCSECAALRLLTEQQAAEIAHRDAMLTKHAEAAAIFQPGGFLHKRADLPLGGSVVVEGIKWLLAELEKAEKVASIRTRMIDIPTAWELTRATDKNQHHSECSYRTAAMLCDCAAANVMEHVSGLLRNANQRAEQAEAERDAARSRLAQVEQVANLAEERCSLDSAPCWCTRHFPFVKDQADAQ